MRRLLALALLAFSLSAQELPKPTTLVSDFADVLTFDEERQLTRELEALDDDAQMIIYLAPSLPEGAVLEELTLNSVNAWGVGRKGVDDGIAIFAFMKDRKLRIEIGLGLGKKITNAQAKAIIDEQITPAFRRKAFAEGLSAAIAQIRTLLKK